jgi:hypothetical protein
MPCRSHVSGVLAATVKTRILRRSLLTPMFWHEVLKSVVKRQYMQSNNSPRNQCFSRYVLVPVKTRPHAMKRLSQELTQDAAAPSRMSCHHWRAQQAPSTALQCLRAATQATCREWTAQRWRAGSGGSPPQPCGCSTRCAPSGLPAPPRWRRARGA